MTSIKFRVVDRGAEYAGQLDMCPPSCTVILTCNSVRDGLASFCAIQRATSMHDTVHLRRFCSIPPRDDSDMLYVFLQSVLHATHSL